MKSRLYALMENLFVFTVGPVLILLFSPKARTARYSILVGGGGLVAAWWSGFLVWALGAAVALIPNAWMGGPLTADERYVMQRTLTESVDEDHPVYQHALRTERRGLLFAELEGVPAGAMAAAAWLHDSAAEHPAIPQEQRFCAHGITGAVLSGRVLLQLAERRPWAAIAVADAVARHVGPSGFNWEWQDRRWASKACPEQHFARPVSALSRTLYDVAMLDTLTVEHVVERAQQRMTSDRRKDLQHILRTGTDSVLKELSDGVQTLTSRSGKACGRPVARHSSAFIKGLDFQKVRNLGDLNRAAQEFVKAQPAPECLEAPSPALLDTVDARADEETLL